MPSLIRNISQEAQEADWIELAYNFIMVLDMSQCTDYERSDFGDAKSGVIKQGFTCTLTLESIANSLYGNVEGSRIFHHYFNKDPNAIDRELNSSNPHYYFAGLIRARDMGEIKITDLEHNELPYLEPDNRLTIWQMDEEITYARPGDLQFFTEKDKLDFVRLNYYRRVIPRSRGLECLVN